MTCVLELDGIKANLTHEFFQRARDRLEVLGIPYTLHWGKINFTAPRLRRMHGSAAVESWLQARYRVLPDAATRAVLTNEFMRNYGLDLAPAAALLVQPAKGLRPSPDALR